MAGMHYQDFDLLFERAESGYSARVLNSPAGQASACFRLPFHELELENLFLKMGRPRRGVRRGDFSEMEEVKKFGGKLFDAVFQDELRACLRSSLDETARQECGLRLRLRLTDVPELADLPWEYLYHAGLNRFLALSAGTPIVRFLDLPQRIRALAVKPPLRVLVMISAPSDHPRLDAAQEWLNLQAAFAKLRHGELLALERLEGATLSALQKRLQQKEYHIFHYIGHAGFNKTAQDGVLILEDEAGLGRPVSGQYLGTLLHDHRTLRLAVLNACEGARSSRNDLFAGVAQSLVQQDIPAVIAMQFEVTDEAAITFARQFYDFLAASRPVDAALAEARKALFIRGNNIEWGTPVLYMRSPDGQIFDLNQTPSLPAREEAALLPQIKSEHKKSEPKPAAQPALKSPPSHKAPPRFRNVALALLGLLVIAAIVWSARFFSRPKPEPVVIEKYISIATEPRGAILFLNGDSVGVTPIKLARSDAGVMRLQLRKTEYARLDTTVALFANTPAALFFKLKKAAPVIPQLRVVAQASLPTDKRSALRSPPITEGSPAPVLSKEKPALFPPVEAVEYGGITVTAKPEEATIWLDEKEVGVGHYENRRLREGKYRLVIRKTGYRGDSLTVNVRSGEVSATKATLAPLLGAIKILVKPFGSIYIDGKLHRQNTDVLYTSKLAAGMHEIKAVHPAFGEWEKSVSILGEGAQNATFDFNQTVKLTVVSEPTWGEIFVDEQATGFQTTKELKLRAGKRKIEVRRAGYVLEGEPVVVTLEADLATPLKFQLKKAE